MHTISILDKLSKTFNDDQAKAIVKALEEFETTKQHVTNEQLNASLKDTEIRLIKWVIGLMIAQTSITIAILKIIG
ncbi:MAG: hypothetical protein ACE5GV_01095 [Candidatus Scalindua sp.]